MHIGQIHSLNPLADELFQFTLFRICNLDTVMSNFNS